MLGGNDVIQNINNCVLLGSSKRSSGAFKDTVLLESQAIITRM